MPRLSIEQTKRAEQTRPRRDDDQPDAQLPSDLGCMNRSIASKDNQRAPTGITPAFGRNRARDPHHVRDGNQVDSVRGLQQVETDAGSNALVQLPARGFGVDSKTPAE